MKLKQPNPLNFFNVRKTQFCPKHFEVITVEQTYNMESSISRWISENLKKRYFISRDNSYTIKPHRSNCLKVGFEDPKEASYFMLACPHLKYK